MIVIGNYYEERKSLQKYLSKEFEMKGLCPLNIFLRLNFLEHILEPFYLKENMLCIFYRDWYVMMPNGQHTY